MKGKLIVIGALLIVLFSATALAEEESYYDDYGPFWVVRSRGIGKAKSPHDRFVVYYADGSHEVVNLRILPEEAVNKGRYSVDAWKASFYYMWYDNPYSDEDVSVYRNIKIARGAINIFPWNPWPWKNLAAQYYYIDQKEMGDKCKENFKILLEKGYTWEKMCKLLWAQGKTESFENYKP